MIPDNRYTTLVKRAQAAVAGAGAAGNAGAADSAAPSGNPDILGGLKDFYSKYKVPINRMLIGGAASGIPMLLFGDGSFGERLSRALMFGLGGSALAGIAHGTGAWDKYLSGIGGVSGGPSMANRSEARRVALRREGTKYASHIPPEERRECLSKLAFYGEGRGNDGGRGRAPYTVGDGMRAIAANQWLPDGVGRRALDGIVSSGVPVDMPVDRIAKGAIGALIGKSVTGALGMGSFWKGLGTVIGARRGYGNY